MKRSTSDERRSKKNVIDLETEMARSNIEKKKLGNGCIPITSMNHPETHRAVRKVDMDHVQRLKAAMIATPEAIVAPLGVNVPSNMLFLSNF